MVTVGWERWEVKYLCWLFDEIYRKLGRVAQKILTCGYLGGHRLLFSLCLYLQILEPLYPEARFGCM